MVPVSPVDIKNDAEFEENLDQHVNNSKSFKKAQKAFLQNNQEPVGFSGSQSLTAGKNFTENVK